MANKHPFVKGQRVKCIRASEQGIPIVEGQAYTVRSAFFGNQSEAEACIAGMERLPGVSVEEASGYFTADRFEAIADDS